MAYGRTFLQVVNDVLRELREPEVSTWDENDYSKLIGQFVNSIKRTTEDAHRWNALRDTFQVSTVASTITYSFTGTDGRAQVLDAWNTTTNSEMRQRTWRSMNAMYFGASTQDTGNVDSWTANGINPSTGEAQVDVHPIPDSVQVLKFTVYAPQDDLTVDSDVLAVPHRPVVEGAVARARNERGEDGGTSFADQAQFMSRALADHIAIDINQHPEDVLWEAV